MSVVSLVVRLVDQFSAKVPGIVDGIDKINGGGSSGKGGGATKRALGLTAAAGGIVVAAGKIEKSMRGIRDSIARTAAFDDMLQGIAQTGDMADVQLASLRNTILNLGPVLGRLPTQIADVANELVAAGISPDRAEKMLSPIGRVAVATRSEIGDINKAAMSMAQNLEIAADDIERTFDKIWTAAKRGNFELKDMAQFFPTIAAAASSRGMTGIGAAVELAAAAQIVRETAGKDVGQAATNLKNLLFKMTAPQTIKKFEKYGVDLKAAMEKGVAEGRSPLETIILETRKLLDANKDLTVGNLFQDTTAQLALSKLVEKYDQFIAIRSEASAATGTIAADFAKMASTLQASLDRMEASIDRREKMWGKLVEPFERMRAGLLAGFNSWLADLAARAPRLAGALGVVGMAFGDIASVVSNVWPTLLGFASSLAIGKFLGIGRVLAGVGKLIVRGLAGGFFWLLRFPAAILAGVMQGFAQGLAPFAARLAPLFARLGPALLAGLAVLGPILLRGLFFALRVLTGPVGWALLAAQLAYIFRAEIGAAFSGLATWLQERFREMFGSISLAEVGAKLMTSLAQLLSGPSGWALLATQFADKSLQVFGNISLADVGARLMQSLLDGLKRAAESVIGWASGFVGRLKSLFSFSASPTIAPPGGGGSSPAAIPQSYRPAGLTPAPSRQASVTFNNTFSVNGAGDPENAARRILAALDRQRQASLYDGALA